MPRNGCLLLLISPWCLLAFTGCYSPQQAYYVSPFNGNTGEYHTLPLRTDSAHTAFYINATSLSGTANDYKKDHFSGFRGSVTAAHHFGLFQFYYGLDLTLGSYSLGQWDTARYTPGIFQPPPQPLALSPAAAANLNTYSGPKFFGGTGFSGGINGVIPVRGGEWRFLGVETALTREFGHYLSFRQQLPDSAATLIIRNRFFGTIGLSSEMIGRTRYGEFGFRVSGGWVLGRDYQHPRIYDLASKGQLGYGYESFSFHYTGGHCTGFLQLNLGEKATSVNVGLNYRLSGPRLPPKEDGRHR